MNAIIARPEASVKPAHPAAHVDVLVPPIPFNTFETWPGLSVLAESWKGSALRVSLDHPDAAVTLAALRLLGAQRVEPGQ